MSLSSIGKILVWGCERKWARYKTVGCFSVLITTTNNEQMGIQKTRVQRSIQTRHKTTEMATTRIPITAHEAVAAAIVLYCVLLHCTIDWYRFGCHGNRRGSLPVLEEIQKTSYTGSWWLFSITDVSSGTACPIVAPGFRRSKKLIKPLYDPPTKLSVL